MSGRIIVLTGERGVGKTTVCREVAALAAKGKHACAGILTLSQRDGNLDVRDVRSGDERRLTLEPGADPPAPSTGLGAGQGVAQGRFCFDPETLAWGNASLSHAMPCELLVVDELGPLEIEREEGWVAAFEALRGGDFALAIAVVRPELVVKAQLRLPASATTVLTVTPDSRDALPPILLEMLEREINSISK